MNIKEAYNELAKKELSLADFKTIVDLKNQCMVEMNQEYLYLCDILIIDLYINENLLDDALNITLKNINNIDSIVFKKLYVSFLEHAIYIFIQKKNYKSAYRYAYMKRKAIDLENIDEVNRWYLEMAYIFAELNQKDKALLNLKAILNNYPNDFLRALTLSNMTKLYIDQKQIAEAKDSLNDCISLVYKLDDEEGITYCEYLNAKLYILENNYKLAKQSFQDIFKNLHHLTDDYLSIANEYIALLVEMDLYDEAYRISIKYLKSVEKSNDLYIKKDYYKNYLKIYILKNKNVRDDLKQLLHAIDVLETEIEKTDYTLLNETNEDDKNLEVQSRLRDLMSRIETIINLSSLALKNDNIRENLMEFSRSLEEFISFDEVLFVILTKADLEVIPEFLDTFNKVNTYQYKKGRLYERSFSFNNLSGTIIEMLISLNHEVLMDFTETPIPVKNLLTDESYTDEGVKTLFALPLYYEKELFGCVIFTSLSENSLEHSDTLNLKLAGKLLEFKLISLFYQENLRSQNIIMQTAIRDLKEGMFYLDPENKKILLTEQLANFLQSNTRIISQEDYLKMIVEDDKKIYENSNRFIEAGESYRSEYRIQIGDRQALVLEQTNPYINKDGVIKFYVGTLTKLDNEIQLTKDMEGSVYGKQDYYLAFDVLSSKAKDLEFKCTFAKFHLLNKESFAPEIYQKIYEYLGQVIKTEFSEATYSLNEDTFISILEINDQRLIDKKVKTILGICDQGIIYDDLAFHFDLKVAVVRFPRDTYNLQEIESFLDIALLTSNRYQIFNDDIHKSYLKKSAITTCVVEQLKREHIELLFLKLETRDGTLAFEVRYNIPGLHSDELVSRYLDPKVLIPFERLLLKTLIKMLDELTMVAFLYSYFYKHP